MEAPTPKLRKKVCVQRTRQFEQRSLTGDPHALVDYITSLKGTGTLHIHFSQGTSSAADWDTRHTQPPPIVDNA